MTAAFDTTDIPTVPRDALALAMRLLIDDGRGLILMRGASPEDRARLEKSFWAEFKGETAEGVATLLRLWSMIDVFQSRRLRALLLDRGFQLVHKALAEAAHQRINIAWGFNPQRFLMALAKAPVPVRPAPQVETASIYAMAA